MPKTCNKYIEQFFKPTGSESQDQRQKLALKKRWEIAKEKYNATRKAKRIAKREGKPLKDTRYEV